MSQARNSENKGSRRSHRSPTKRLSSILSCSRNAAGTSEYSPPASGTPVKAETAPLAPAAPTPNPGDGQLAVTWTAVDGATSYEVHWSTQADTLTIPSANMKAVTGLSGLFDGLANGTSYYVWVKAVNAIGASGFSLYSSATPLPPPTATTYAGSPSTTPARSPPP